MCIQEKVLVDVLHGNRFPLMPRWRNMHLDDAWGERTGVGSYRAARTQLLKRLSSISEEPLGGVHI